MGFVIALLLVLVSAQPAAARADYWIYVASESADEVALVRFGSEGAVVEKTIPVGVRPTEIEGPHGLAVDAGGDFWYVSLAHGNPFGTIYKYRTGTDDLAGSAEAGLFPATLDTAAATGLLYVVNFDLHGDMTPSTVSVVDAASMTEVAEIEVGVMPHGSRMNAAGDRHYSVMMMSDELVEIDAYRFEVRRRLSLSGEEDAPHGGHGETGTSMREATVRPTWAEPGPDGRFVYVAANGAGEIHEVDIEAWEVIRTFQTAPGPYNLAATPDGRLLVVTHRSDGSIGIWNLAEGREIHRIPSSRPLPHGVVISPDSRYAFVSVEGIGGEPGAVDVIDLEQGIRAATVEVGKQASGIAFWKMGTEGSDP